MKKKLNLVLLLASLMVLGSCSSKNDNVVLPEEDEDPITFRSLNIANLESEVAGLIGKSFSCGNFLFNDCYLAAEHVYNAFTNGYSNNQLNQIIIANSNNTNNRRTIRLAYDNSYDRTLERLNDHLNRHTPTTPLPPTNSELKESIEENFRNTTGINLNCRHVSLVDCQKVNRILIALYDNSFLPNTLNRIRVTSQTDEVRYTGALLVVGSDAKIGQVRRVLNNTTPTTPTPTPTLTPLQRVKRELRRETDIRLSCGSRVTDNDCLNVARETLTVFRQGTLSQGRIMRIEVVNDINRARNTREILHLPSDANSRSISGFILLHNRQF